MINYCDYSIAKESPYGVVIFAADMGRQIYLTAKLSAVKCSKNALLELLMQIDASEIGWNDPDGLSVGFAITKDRMVTGGMCGGEINDGIWIHSYLNVIREKILAVLEGRSNTLQE